MMLGQQLRPRLAERYRAVRATTARLCEPLAVEDFVVQSMPDVSPTKWHLAHVSWFFETFVLKPNVPGYRPAHDAFEYLFNSYYNTIGQQHPRPRRGVLTRPTVAEVFDYRSYVDERVERLLEPEADLLPETSAIVELGLHHEQQHQELLLMDIKHVLSCNPLFPAYQSAKRSVTVPADGQAVEWLEFPEGLRTMGHGGDGFSFDNERPAHRVFVPAFRLASRLVTNEEYLEFIREGGYRRSELWLADGWDRVREEGWQAPLYWKARDGEWNEFTLAGLQPLDPHAAVCHLSYYEADAFAAWSGARLPTEAEWEAAAAGVEITGNFLEDLALHPLACPATGTGARQLFGDVWEWTASAYGPYPGFIKNEGALGEYNGKFMCNQQVLRGGSCVTSRSHIRPTYRNFFYPHTRWHFSGVRLARDA